MDSLNLEAVDSESVDLVKSFIDWVDCLINDEDDIASFRKPKAIPRYARSTHEDRENIVLIDHTAYNKGISKYDNDSSVKYSFENKALLTVRAHDAMNPKVNNSISKCNAIERSMMADPRKKRMNEAEEEGEIYSDALKLKARMNSTRITQVEVLDSPVNKDNNQVIIEGSAKFSPGQVFDNTHMWSEKSFQLESYIGPHVLQVNLRENWDSDRLCFDFNLLHSLDDNLELGIVDTLFVANTDDYDYHQLSASRDDSLYANISNSNFSVAKLPAARYSIARIHSDFAYFGGRFRLRREVYSYRDIDDSIYSMLERRFDSHGPASDMEGVLKGVKSTGSIHVRPLCTVGDILVAIHDLLDPREFQCGCIQLPQLLSAHLHRNYEGVYRYSYDRYKPDRWQYLRWSESLGPLRQYLCPVLCGAKDAFQIEELECDNVDAELRAKAAVVMQHFHSVFCMSRCLTQLTIDFEMSVGKGFTQTETEVNFYRIANISSAKFMDRFAILRRSAIPGIDLSSQQYLIKFKEAFSSAWRQQKRRQRQERFNKLQVQSVSSNSGGIDSFAYGVMDMDSLRGFSRGAADGGPNATYSEISRPITGRSGVHSAQTAVWRGLRSREMMLAKSGNTPQTARSGRSDSRGIVTGNNTAESKYSISNIPVHVTEHMQRAVARSSASSGDESEEEFETDPSGNKIEESSFDLDAEMRENFTHIDSFIQSEDFIEILASHFVDETDSLGIGENHSHEHLPHDSLIDGQHVKTPTSDSHGKLTGSLSSDLHMPSPTTKTETPTAINISPEHNDVENLEFAISRTSTLPGVDKKDDTRSEPSFKKTVKEKTMKSFRARTPPAPTKVDTFLDRSAKLLRDAQRVKRLIRTDRSARRVQLSQHNDDIRGVELQPQNNDTDDGKLASSSDGDVLNDLAYDIAKAVTTDELFGHFSVKNYMNNESLLIMRPELSISDDSNWDYESATNLDESNSKTRAWLRRNNAGGSKSSARKPDKESVAIHQENVELINKERFQKDCDRVMCSIIAGIDSSLGMKIRMGLMKFNPLRVQSKSRKKKNRKRRPKQTIDISNFQDAPYECLEPIEPLIPEENQDEKAEIIFPVDQEIAGRKIAQFILRYRKRIIAGTKIAQFILRHRKRINKEDILSSSPVSLTTNTSSSSSSLQSDRSEKGISFNVTLSLLTVGKGDEVSEKKSAVCVNQVGSRGSNKERKSMKDFSDSSSGDVSEQEYQVGADREYDEFSESVIDEMDYDNIDDTGENDDGNHEFDFDYAEGESESHLSKKAKEIHSLVNKMRSTILKNFKSLVADSSFDKDSSQNTQLLQSIDRVDAQQERSVFRVVHQLVQHKSVRSQQRLEAVEDNKISISDSETESDQQTKPLSNLKPRKRTIGVPLLKRPRRRPRPVPIKKGPNYVLKLDGGACVDESGFYRTKSPEIHVGTERKFDRSRIRFSNSVELANIQSTISNSSSSSCMVSEDSENSDCQIERHSKYQKKASKKAARSYFTGGRALTLQDYMILGQSMLKKVDQSILSCAKYDSHKMVNDLPFIKSTNFEKLPLGNDGKKTLRNQTKNLLSAVKLALISLDGRVLDIEKGVDKGDGEVKIPVNAHISEPPLQRESHSLRSDSLWGEMLCDIRDRKAIASTEVSDITSADTHLSNTAESKVNAETDGQVSLADSSTFVSSLSDDATNFPSIHSSEHDIQYHTTGVSAVEKGTISPRPKDTKNSSIGKVTSSTPTGKGLYIISQSYKSAPKLNPAVKSVFAPKTKNKHAPIVLPRNYSSVVLGTPYETSHSRVEDTWQVLDSKDLGVTDTNAESSDLIPYIPEREGDPFEDTSTHKKSDNIEEEVKDASNVLSLVKIEESMFDRDNEINCETPETRTPLIFSPPSTAHFPRKKELSELNLEVVASVYERMLGEMMPSLLQDIQDSKNLKRDSVLIITDDDDESSGLVDSDSKHTNEPLVRMGSATWYLREDEAFSDSVLLNSPSECSIIAVNVQSVASFAEYLPSKVVGNTQFGRAISPNERFVPAKAAHLSPLDEFLAQSNKNQTQNSTVGRNPRGNNTRSAVNLKQPSRKLNPPKIARAQLAHHQAAAKTEFKPEPPVAIVSSKLASPTKTSLHRKLTGGT